VTSNLNAGNHPTGYIVNVTIIQGDAVWLPWLGGGVEQVELEESGNIAKTNQLLTCPLRM
jgi:hypothetical protein